MVRIIIRKKQRKMDRLYTRWGGLTQSLGKRGMTMMREHRFSVRVITSCTEHITISVANIIGCG